MCYDAMSIGAGSADDVLAAHLSDDEERPPFFLKPCGS
jgi:choline dehydrogenase-like flavoprotein